MKEFRNEKKHEKQMLRDVVAQGPSNSCRIKNVDGYFFPRAMLILRGRAPAKEGLSLGRQTAMGLWSCHGEQAVKGACTVTKAGRD